MLVKVLKYTGLLLGVMGVIATIGIVITQRISDGPNEFLQGGPFQSGDLVATPVTDWSFAVGKNTQFELVGFGTSRTAGFIMHDGIAYMTCDLGFMWNRLPPGLQKNILHIIYLFKHWHLDAVQDGRALLRIDGKIYKTTFVKVEDPDLNAILRVGLEDRGREYLGDDMGPAPTELPNDVWFFRMDPATW